ncbi:MAG TPA: phosphoribosylglycinamide formyltransferase [Methermicoccus shengliensis]|uniref:phosphoribosylglycinamide formyltransferase 1 n=2 Tax=Methermicoccus shengliensis TaxID=660064 RepID=A0A832RYH6_9EURY|nr:phosphoribosylglycinamide formyltransferase [Methermicoccus shengliensis]HIH69696.1 phosphoribosylglycinamide formyltransferase [Methermicoccus shengliensis]
MTMSERVIGVLASGRGSNLQSIIDHIEGGYIKNARIGVVISDRASAYALERARRHGIEAVYINPHAYPTKEEYEQKVLEVLEEHGVELVLLAGYMRIVGDTLLDAYEGRMLNIHPALLPAFRGLHAQRQALEYGVKVAGCTVHFVDREVDHGPIIIQRCVEVREDDTEETLSARILEQEHKIYPEAVRLYLEGKLKIEGRRVRVLE